MTKNELAKDLRSLSGLLSNWGRVKNPGVLTSITYNEVAENISYSIVRTQPLIFINAEIDRHCLPMGIEKLPDTEVQIKLTTLHVEELGQQPDNDPLRKLGVNIVVGATYLKGDTIAEATCSWHLDRHTGNVAQYFHPMYHINFGGSHMENLPTNFGNLLLLNSPRIIHPPLDIILSCDFVIRNFYSKANSSNVLNNVHYKFLLKKARARYWQPYARAMASEWYEELAVQNLSSQILQGH
jgi:hypothetical protein